MEGARPKFGKAGIVVPENSKQPCVLNQPKVQQVVPNQLFKENPERNTLLPAAPLKGMYGKK